MSLFPGTKQQREQDDEDEGSLPQGGANPANGREKIESSAEALRERHSPHIFPSRIKFQSQNRAGNCAGKILEYGQQSSVRFSRIRYQGPFNT
jgi:hypothetical protein